MHSCATNENGPQNSLDQNGYSSEETRGSDDSLRWNSSFMNWVVSQAGFDGTGSIESASWASWGVADQRHPEEDYEPGCVVVLSLPGRAGLTRHLVGLAISFEGNSVSLLGGNLAGSVMVTRYPAAEVVSCRWPPGS